MDILKLRAARKSIAMQAHAIPKVDLVHTQYADFSWNGVRVYEDLYEVFSRHCRSPLVMTLHEHPWFRNEHSWDAPDTASDLLCSRLAGYWRMPPSFPLEVFQRHRGIHVHHDWQKDVLVRFGVPKSMIRVIPLFVPSCKAPDGQVADFRQRFGLQGKRIIAMTGFVFERKRYDRILELLPELPADVVLCALGGANNPASETYLEKLVARAKVLGVSSRFVVAGYLPEAEINAGLLASDVFAAPYGEVTSSASVARCIGAGAPIVAGKCETFEELEANGAGMVVVDAEDRGTMRQLVLKLLDGNDRGLVSGLRQKNASYADRWSLSNVAREVQEWYRECLG
ncbi:MAG: glycosyltransferase [bacterium]